MGTNGSDLENLPLATFREAIDRTAKRNSEGKTPGRVLIEAGEFANLLAVLLNVRATAKTLRTYGSARVGLLPPPVKKDGKLCYVYPDHLDRAAFALTLRQVYHLPLGVIRELDKHFPTDCRHLVLERKLTLEELLDLAKMLPRGFAIEDLVMAKTCDLMVEDTLAPARALQAATQPGAALRRTEEAAILSRLDQIRDWVVSGRRQKFVARESAQDFQNLARNKLLAAKIIKKVLARRARARR